MERAAASTEPSRSYGCDLEDTSPCGFPGASGKGLVLLHIWEGSLSICVFILMGQVDLEAWRNWDTQVRQAGGPLRF